MQKSGTEATMVYSSIHFFFYFCSNTLIVMYVFNENDAVLINAQNLYINVKSIKKNK